MGWSLAILALVLIGVAAISKRISGSPITPAILFVSFGLLIGPEALDAVDISSTGATVRTLAEATLALVLFSDASRIDFGGLRREISVPLRLLGIGLPLTIGLGAVAAALIFDQITAGEALILAVILAPTDAALGQAVVTEPRVPERIRQGLNVESGLNDGICVPLLFAAVAVADVESEIAEGRSAGTLLLEEIGFGIIGGVAAGLLVASVLIYAGRRDLITGTWHQVIPAAGAALAYGIASGLGGSGFIAAFVAGMVFRLALRRDPEEDNRLTEEVAGVLNGVTFVLFGAILLGPALGELSWELALYAILSLTSCEWCPSRSGCWARSATADGRLPRLVRAPRPRLDRLRRDPDRGVPASPRGPDRPGDLHHGGTLRLRPRPHRRPARRPLRGLVRAPPARRGAADGGSPDRGDPHPRLAGAEARARAYCDPSSSAGSPRPLRAWTRLRTRPPPLPLCFCLMYSCATEVSSATSTPKPVRM